MTDDNKVYGWDDQLDPNAGAFTEIPPGTYSFRVKSFARSQYTPSPKSTIPACPMAKLTIEIRQGDNKLGELNHNLYLCEKCAGILAEFFVGVGLRKHGEPFKMNWNAVPGTTGFCKVEDHKYKKDGEDKSYPQIKRFLDPSKPLPDAPATPAAADDPPPF
jgi:hypothetical protein